MSKIAIFKDLNTVYTGCTCIESKIKIALQKKYFFSVRKGIKNHFSYAKSRISNVLFRAEILVIMYMLSI